jgi:hypothetical protein
MSRPEFLKALFSISGALLIFVGRTHAATQVPASSTSPQFNSGMQNEPPSMEQFHPGDWTFQMDGAFIRARTSPRLEQFVGGQVGVGYFWTDRLSVNAYVPVYWVNQDSPSAIGAGLDLIARWQFFERGRLSLYLDGGAGILISNHDIPRRGTRTNFMPQVGIGATWMLDRQTFLYGGARVWHFSNAGILGSDRNPSIDEALMAYIGIGWKL